MRQLSDALAILKAPPDLRDHVALNPQPTFRDAFGVIVDDLPFHVSGWFHRTLWPDTYPRCLMWRECSLCFELESIRIEREIIRRCWPEDLRGGG